MDSSHTFCNAITVAQQRESAFRLKYRVNTVGCIFLYIVQGSELPHCSKNSLDIINNRVCHLLKKEEKKPCHTICKPFNGLMLSDKPFSVCHSLLGVLQRHKVGFFVTFGSPGRERERKKKSPKWHNLKLDKIARKTIPKRDLCQIKMLSVLLTVARFAN